MHETDVITLAQARTLDGAFRERVGRSPNATAYIQYDEASQSWQEFSWTQTADLVARWQEALLAEGLKPGERVAMMLHNCREWVIFDQAAQGLGLVTVPIYPNDRKENVAYILQDAGVRLFLIDNNEQWQALQEIQDQLAGLVRIVSLQPVETVSLGPWMIHASDWIPSGASALQTSAGDPDDLATIVYTSGTTGRAKGVMLSHRNMLSNALACVKLIDIFPDDLMLSFLPLSHTLERTLGYYLPILTGCSVAYARSVPQLAEDLVRIRPTILISVPRIFERVYGRIQEKLEHDPAIARRLFNQAVEIGWKRFEYRQKRAAWSPDLLLWPLLQGLVGRKVQAKLGGRIRFAVSGGAALSPDIAKLFIGLGINIQQGYGLTETSPVITANPLEDNRPASVGVPLEGVEVKTGDDDELLTRSPSVMLGYWNNPEATRQVIDQDGWLHTGDQARIADGHVYITGRLKEILVLANGEKVSPVDMEMAITMDSLFDQALVIGEGRPFLSALVVPNPEELANLARQLGLDPDSGSVSENKDLKRLLLERIHRQLHAFPGYAKIRNLSLIREPWSIENDLMTPTLKMRRARIVEQCRNQVETLYRGH